MVCDILVQKNGGGMISKSTTVMMHHFLAPILSVTIHGIEKYT